MTGEIGLFPPVRKEAALMMHPISQVAKLLPPHQSRSSDGADTQAHIPSFQALAGGHVKKV